MATAEVTGTLAIRELDEKEYTSQRQQEMVDYVKNAKSGDVFNLNGATAKATDTIAIVTSNDKGVSKGTSDLALKYGELAFQHISQTTNKSSHEN